jgi:hypothetical protein
VLGRLRRRWRSWFILVVLVAVVGGLALGAVAAGRGTATAFPRFVAAHGYDVYIFNPRPLPELAKLPEVASVTAVGNPGSGTPACACSHPIIPSDFYVNELTESGLHRLVKMVSGRMPSASSPYDVLASYNLAQDYGMHIGSTIRVPFYGAAQRNEVLSGAGVSPSGPIVTFHVVGFEAAELEFPDGQAPEYDLFTTRAFNRAVSPRLALAHVYLVRLRNGSADLRRFSGDVRSLHIYYVSNQESSASAVAQSIHPQAVGWWILALLAGLVGMATIGQGLGRQGVVESEEYPKLVALGLPPHQLVSIGAARNLVIAGAGAVGAVLIAFLLSPLAPVGEARLAEPSPGFAFDPLILLPGALAVIVVVFALGLWPRCGLRGCEPATTMPAGPAGRRSCPACPIPERRPALSLAFATRSSGVGAPLRYRRAPPSSAPCWP